MEGVIANCRVAALVLLVAWVGIAALYWLLKPVPNGCVMTYMYPTYIPIPTPPNVSAGRYGLFLYHEGWKKIDFADHLNGIDGVPVLFIPGNGGSYKQVRSLAAESSRAYQGGPPEPTFYREADFFSLGMEGNSLVEDTHGFVIPNQYRHKLDWFAVDLEGEHSAMDGRILEEHTEYIVRAIHMILDQYQESQAARSIEGAGVSGSLPTSVILVGHSMGGFVARAALVHPQLRKSAVETILTLSSPHQSPPVPLQPSLGYYFSQVNEEWRKGYLPKTTHSGRFVSSPSLSNVVVVSISGGVFDYQVRSKLTSLDGIVPSSHGFMMSSSGMKNVFLSMDHQSILWCNQLVLQVSHTLHCIINPETGRPFSSTQKRLLVFIKMLQSGLPLDWMGPVQSSIVSEAFHVSNAGVAQEFKLSGLSSCPPSHSLSDGGFEKDLYIHSSSVTILAMDGRRRWLDIKKLGSAGKKYFVFVTNLAPCSGVRLHLWPEKGASPDKLPASKWILEVTSKLVHIPSGPAPRQIEPGSQTEQAPPSAVLRLSPEELNGYRFLTISVAPRLTVSGRPPPAVSMAVGQFFNPEEGEITFPLMSFLHSTYDEKEVLIKEDHPLAMKISFSISLGLVPVTLSLMTVGCGINNSEQAEDMEQNGICKLRCFPPVALAWDSTSGLHVIPNLYSETVIVDSSPPLWDSIQSTDKTAMLLLVDPHCSYRINVMFSFVASAGRFCLLYSPQIIGFMIATTLFGLARQAHAWELDLSIPSILTAVESNLRMPVPLLLLVLPMFISLVLSFLRGYQLSPILSSLFLTLACYAIANGSVIILILISRLILSASASTHFFVKKWWQSWGDNFHFVFLHQIICFSFNFFSLKVVRILRESPNIVAAFISAPLVFFVHPSLGLIVLLLSHALKCHVALFSFLATSFHSHAHIKEFNGSQTRLDQPFPSEWNANNTVDPLLPLDESCSSSPNPAKSFSESQLEIFNHQHGILILHILATLMFVPSLVAWLRRIGMGPSLPWFVDSVLCVGVILHGLCGSKPDINCISVPFFGFSGQEFGISLIYLLSGYYSFMCALCMAPGRAFSAMAFVGATCLVCMVIVRLHRERGDFYFRRRRHSHKH